MTMPSTFRLIVEYNGTRFNGFQSQNPNDRKNHQHYQRLSKRPRYDDQGNVTMNDTSQPSTGKPSSSSLGGTTTIQDCLQDAIIHWSGQTDLALLNLRYCSRTDKGVHAKGQVVVISLDIENSHHVTTTTTTSPPSHDATDEDDTTTKISTDVVAHSTASVIVTTTFLRYMRKSINSRLPWDISISSISTCPNTFHPRYDVVCKQYSYTIKYHRKVPDNGTNQYDAATSNHNDNDNDDEATTSVVGGGIHTLRNALQDGPCIWLCPWPLDDSRMNQICERLQGIHNYAAFWHKQVRRQKQQQETTTTTTKQQEIPKQYLKKFSMQILSETEELVVDDDEEEELLNHVAKVDDQEVSHHQHPNHDDECNQPSAAKSRSFSSDHNNIPTALDQEKHCCRLRHRRRRRHHVVVTVQLILQAKSFQRSQCRNLVGLVIDICRGHVPESILDQIFLSDHHNHPNDDTTTNNNNNNFDPQQHVEQMASYISAAPASGLCLDQVWYSNP